MLVTLLARALGFFVVYNFSSPITRLISCSPIGHVAIFLLADWLYLPSGDLVCPYARQEFGGKYQCSLTNDEGSTSNLHEYVVRVIPPDNWIDEAKTSSWLVVNTG